MLIKIANKWVDASTVTEVDWTSNNVNGEKTYFLYIRHDRENCFCGRYDTKEGVIKAMDEGANKINAVQGCKLAEEGKVVMKYVEHGDEPSVDVYRCSHCKTGLQAYDWYKFCPYCGREIERWK